VLLLEMVVIQGLHNLLRQTNQTGRGPEGTDLYLVYATIGLVIATGILAGITYYYARQTKHLVEETRKLTEETREQAKIPFIPFISTSWKRTEETSRDGTANNIVLHVTNVGVGTATNVMVRYSIPSLGITEQTTSFVSMLPGSTSRLSIPVKQPDRGDQVEIYVRYEYDNILGGKYKREEDLTLSHDLIPK
jgi:hypothetical protein